MPETSVIHEWLGLDCTGTGSNLRCLSFGGLITLMAEMMKAEIQQWIYFIVKNIDLSQ